MAHELRRSFVVLCDSLKSMTALHCLLMQAFGFGAVV